MYYKEIDENDINYLLSIIPPERLKTGEEISDDYSHDELGGVVPSVSGLSTQDQPAHSAAVSRKPDVLIEALSADEISKVATYANAKKIPVIARGSGTGLVGGSVPVHGGIMISLQKMNRIIELDEENLVLTVEPGVLLMEIAAFVEERGLFYPPDPGEKTATIGGNISTNAGGMRAVKYGVTRDFVRGLEVVLPSGEIVELGGKVVKLTSGYSLKDLLIGSEGTLGIITKATLKLLPLPPKAISLLIPFDNVSDAIKTVPELMKTKLLPSAVEFMEREVILDAEDYLGKKFPDKSADSYLLITYDGLEKADIERNYEAVANVCFPRGGKDLLIIDDERRESVWSARGAFLEAIKASTTEMDECDVVVPKAKVADFVEYARLLRSVHDIRIKYFGHAGDGNLHIYILRDDLDEAAWNQKLEAVFNDLYAKAIECGGKVSGEHGIGYAKRKYLKESESEAVYTLMKGIKAAFDPNNILNPGKVIFL